MTKYPRKCCSLCNRRLVDWKLLPIRNNDKIRFFFCFDCACVIQAVFNKVNILSKPDKKLMLKKADERAKSVLLGMSPLER